MTRSDRHLDELLGDLPVLDVDAPTAERIRGRAHAELARAGRRLAARRLYRRVEITLTAGLGALYLLWAVHAALLPFR